MWHVVQGGGRQTLHDDLISKRKKKMRVGKDLLKEVVSPETPKPLTRQELLSQVAGLYDLIGLVTPAKQKVRKAIGRILAAWADQIPRASHQLTQEGNHGESPSQTEAPKSLEL